MAISTPNKLKGYLPIEALPHYSLYPQFSLVDFSHLAITIILYCLKNLLFGIHNKWTIPYIVAVVLFHHTLFYCSLLQYFYNIIIVISKSLVDDEDDINFLFKMVLDDNGFKVDTFNDPRIALQNFTAGAYDLLLLDTLMPNMNGFGLYQKIRMIDDKVKVCFLTASGINHEEFKKRAVSVASINDIENCFFIKPIENEELIKRVNEQLL